MTHCGKRILWVCIAAAVLLSGCTVYERTMCRSYITIYNNLRSIQLNLSPAAPNTILINPGSERPVVEYTMVSSGAEKEEYERLCRKHNDLSWNQYRSLPKGMPGGLAYNDKDFVSIDVVCGTRFDDEHPAGASLGDVVRFMSWSPYRYIHSGYTYYHYNPEDISEYFRSIIPEFLGPDLLSEQKDNCCYPIDKMLADLTAEDMILLGYGPWYMGFLHFEKTPSEKGPYNMRVKLVADTGECFEETVEMTF